jgi:hypothetical protein
MPGPCKRSRGHLRSAVDPAPDRLRSDAPRGGRCIGRGCAGTPGAFGMIGGGGGDPELIAREVGLLVERTSPLAAGR